jgi:hypothetical protein
MSNKDVKQDALDNLADALTEDILNTPDDQLFREVEEDYGDPHALANKFDQILERAEKQVSQTARPSPQVRSSVLDLPISLREETIRSVKGIFGFGSHFLEFLSSLSPRTLAWSAIAAAVVILVQAAVITAVLMREQGASSDPSVASGPYISRVLPRAGLNSEGAPGPQVEAPPPSASITPETEAVPISPRLSDEDIAALVAGGLQLMVAGDIPNARLVLQQAAEARNATAALEVGATYDPTILQQQARTDVADLRMARRWYERARDLGSTEAAVRLERLRSLPGG